MSIVRINNLTMSLDGYVAGPNQSLEHPLGTGAENLHDWMLATRAFRERHGMDGGETGTDDDFSALGGHRIGAEIMGRNKFGPVRGPWPDEEWRGWWGEDPPFHTPVFVLTHHPRDPLEMAGGTTFYFVTDGIESALAQARAAAGDLDIAIGGGALTVREYLDADLIDEMHLVVVPRLLVDGARLFDGIDLTSRFDFEPVVSSAAAAHFVLKRR